MAYMDQERKQKLAPQIKRVLKKYGMKGTIATQHHSALVVNIKSGPLDIIGNMIQMDAENQGYWKDREVPTNIQVNEHWIERNYSGEVLDFLTEIKEAMDGCPEFQNHNRSDLMTDYHDVGWYTYINVGRWDKPYILVEKN
jgi:hypothetical protein